MTQDTRRLYGLNLARGLGDKFLKDEDLGEPQSDKCYSKEQMNLYNLVYRVNRVSVQKGFECSAVVGERSGYPLVTYQAYLRSKVIDTFRAPLTLQAFWLATLQGPARCSSHHISKAFTKLLTLPCMQACQLSPL